MHFIPLVMGKFCTNMLKTLGLSLRKPKMQRIEITALKRSPEIAVPSGILVATLGSWVLLLPTIPLMSAASVVKCLTTVPVGGQDTIVLKPLVWHDTGGGCHSSAAPSGLVALSSESIR